VQVSDAFVFREENGDFEFVLTTFCDIEQTDEDQVVIRGQRGLLVVHYYPQVVDYRVKMHNNIDLAEGLRDVNRIVFTWQGQDRQGTVRFFCADHNVLMFNHIRII